MDEEGKRFIFSKEKLFGKIYPNEIEQELKHMSISIDVGEEKNSILLGETILNYNMYSEKLNCF